MKDTRPHDPRLSYLASQTLCAKLERQKLIKERYGGLIKAGKAACILVGAYVIGNFTYNKVIKPTANVVKHVAEKAQTGLENMTRYQILSDGRVKCGNNVYCTMKYQANTLWEAVNKVNGGDAGENVQGLAEKLNEKNKSDAWIVPLPCPEKNTKNSI